SAFSSQHILPSFFSPLCHKHDTNGFASVVYFPKPFISADNYTIFPVIPSKKRYHKTINPGKEQKTLWNRIRKIKTLQKSPAKKFQRQWKPHAAFRSGGAFTL